MTVIDANASTYKKSYKFSLKSGFVLVIHESSVDK